MGPFPNGVRVSDSIFFVTISCHLYLYSRKKSMIKIAVICSVMTIISFQISAQPRYANAMFDEINTETYTYDTKNGEALKLDIYLPQNDPESQRAIVICLNGEGFITGTR